MPGEGVCSGVRADACPGFDPPGQGVEVTGFQAGACAGAHLVAGAGEHLDGQWGPVVVLRVARRGGEQGMLSGTGTLSSAPTLLITSRAERSGDAVNLAAAALRPLKPGHPATLPGLRSRLAGPGADDLPGRVVRGPVDALISCRGEGPVLLPRDSHRPGYGLATRELNRNP